MTFPITTSAMLAGLLALTMPLTPARAQMMPMSKPPAAGPAPAPGAMPGGMMDDKKGAMPGVAAGMTAPMGDDKMKPPMAGGMMGMMCMPPATAGSAAAAGMPTPAAVPLDHVEGRIAFLKAELAITDAQTPGWTDFADALRTSRTHLDASRAALVTSQNATATSPARLEAYEQHLTARLASVRTARDSYQRLYATLNPEQKKNADEMVSPLLASF